LYTSRATGRTLSGGSFRSNLAKAGIFESIEMFYNRTRSHGHIGGVGSEVFEAASNRGS
jgi:hypothetical protein